MKAKSLFSFLRSKLSILLLLLLVSCSTVQRFELQNKITLLVKPLAGTDLVGIDVLVHDGLADESKPGIRNFIQTLLIKGTGKHNATELALLIDELGSVGTSTGEDVLELQFKVEKKNLDKALDLLEEFLQGASFPEEEVEKERGQILEAFKAQEDNPSQLMKKGLLAQLYPNHPYGVTVLGTEQSVKNTTRQDLLDYYHTHYISSRLIISVVGSIDPGEVKTKVEEKLQSFTVSAPERKEIPSPVPLLGKKTQKKKDITDDWIGMAYPGPKVTDKDRAGVILMNSVLGGSMGARLFTNLRDKQGLAYQIGSSYSPLENAGPIFLYMGTHPENKKRAYQGLLLEARNLSLEPPSEKEVEQALNKTLGNFLLNHETLLDQASYLARHEALGLGYDYDERFPEELKKVTAMDIQDLAKKYLQNGTVFIVGPR